jgi:NAD-dependent dihydropyrimidine dehydrogenase PreA subunit
MAYITGLTRTKRMDPQFVVSIDEETCISCGRCYRSVPMRYSLLKKWMRMILPRCS